MDAETKFAPNDERERCCRSVALAIVSSPSGTYQAVTLVGQAESPQELGAKPGSGTAGLGVFDGDKALNTKEGALDGVGDGPHQLTLYVAPSAAVSSGTKLRVYVLRPDKTLVAGGTVTNSGRGGP